MKTFIISLLIKLTILSPNNEANEVIDSNNKKSIADLEEVNSLKYDLYEAVIDGFYDNDTTIVIPNLQFFE